MSAEIVEQIKEYYKYTGCVPTVRDCDGVVLPSYNEIRKHGGLKILLGKAGIQKQKTDLIPSLLRYFDENLDWPKSRDCQKVDYMYSLSTYIEHYDSWNMAIEVAKNERKINRDSE